MTQTEHNVLNNTRIHVNPVFSYLMRLHTNLWQ